MYFNGCCEQLVGCFKSVSFVNLTFDIWSGNAKDDYLSEFALYVNVDWQSEKPILSSYVGSLFFASVMRFSYHQSYY